MISAVDTNTLLGVFLPDKRFAEQSARIIESAVVFVILFTSRPPYRQARYSLPSREQLLPLKLLCR